MFRRRGKPCCEVPARPGWGGIPRFGEKSVELLPWGRCGPHGPWVGPDLTGPVFKGLEVSESARESYALSGAPASALGAAYFQTDRLVGGSVDTEGPAPF